MKKLLLIILIIFVTTPIVFGATTNVYPVADNFIDAESPTVNNGTSVAIQAYESWGTERRTILRFTLPTLTGTISKVTLKLTADNNAQAGINESVFLMASTTGAGWNETQSTWQIYQTGKNWSAYGGDYVNSVVGSSTSVASSSVASFVLMGTGSLHPLTFTWGTTTNLLLKNDASYHAGGWTGSEWVSSNGGAQYWPYLLVEYTPPVAGPASHQINSSADFKSNVVIK